MAEGGEMSLMIPKGAIRQPFYERVNLRSEFFDDVFRSTKRWIVPGFPTMGTDGTNIIIGKEFLESLSTPHRNAVYRHEVTHIVNNHGARMRGRVSDQWNIACDMVINTEMKREGWDLPCKPFYLPPELDTPILPSAEEVYDWLMEKGEELVKQILASGYEGDLKETTHEEELAQAALVAAVGKYAGDSSKTTSQWAIDLLEEHSKLNWKGILSRLFSSWVRGDSTWAIPNKRFIGGGTYLPSPQRKGMNHLLIAVDVSSSMPQKTVQKILADVQMLRKAVETEKLEMVTFNTYIQETKIFQRHSPFKPNLQVGGGTSFEEVIAYANKTKAEACIILTDGGAGDPLTPLAFSKDKLIWIVYDDHTRVPTPGRVYFA